ncbi:hypothetical protein SAMN02745135_01687 [Caloranaerobacter azorensis DSM 13643]|uniref:Uncharacterized protein n=1 Tax=Caloranaerobacter azorensis DSM 13643 TaxID=1121264 RepID=A0A1M5V199_9FIRM|nr:hypothetical protein [Caloranaerobacter azorensis]SHH68956.1 hypothetical protein SAMN02745135_01687 [Caloranaerobacter azorensis DSM 13643]
MNNTQLKKEDSLVQLYNESMIKKVVKIVRTNYKKGNTFPILRLRRCEKAGELLDIISDAIMYLYVLYEHKKLSEQQLETLTDIDLVEFTLNIVAKYETKSIATCISMLSMARENSETK